MFARNAIRSAETSSTNNFQRFIFETVGLNWSEFQKNRPVKQKPKLVVVVAAAAAVVVVVYVTGSSSDHVSHMSLISLVKRGEELVKVLVSLVAEN